MASIFLSACASTTPTTEEELPAVTEDGLQRVPSNTVDAVYRKEGASLASYTAVHIEDCKVSFKKNWMRDQNMDRLGTDETVRQSDVDRIASEMSAAFNEVFTKVLESHGYQVVPAGSAQDVLTLRPAIVDLDVTAPDLRSSTTGISRTFTASAGEMTLNMDLVDSASGARSRARHRPGAGPRRWIDRIFKPGSQSCRSRAHAAQMGGVACNSAR